MKIKLVAATVMAIACTPSSQTEAFVCTKVSSRALAPRTMLKYVLTNENLSQTGCTVNSVTANISLERIEKATKERPYPLFLAEKAASLLVDPFTSPPPRLTKQKEHLVVLGTGWGAAAFLKNIDTDKYDVTVISPRNYFVFTPMLAGASVGSVDFNSITEPIREINSKVRYLEAAATDIDPETRTISCYSIVCDGHPCEPEEFSVNYDRLLFSVGAQTNTFGTPGVEDYCNFLKQVGDANTIKDAIVNCFESAALPNMNEEDIRRELSFVIVGAGPTGVEFAAELLDFVEEDGQRFYRDLLPYVSIKIVDAGPSILAPFEDGMKNEAISRLTRVIEIKGLEKKLQPCKLQLNKLVSEVSDKYVYFKDGEKIQYGMALWAAGIGPLPITTNLVESLGETEQKNAQEFAKGRLGVDPWLRVIGGEGRIFALGDCCSVSHRPSLPASAQVASQEGEFLAKLLSSDYSFDLKDTRLLPPVAMDPDGPKLLSEQIASFAMGESEIAAPFQYLDLGVLAYTGHGSALAQLQMAPGEGDPGSETWHPVRLQIKGKLGFGLWRSIYLWKQTSLKNVASVVLDWAKVKLFGRNTSIL
jgi:NADH dehydrogenase FAD-containing subunit